MDFTYLLFVMAPAMLLSGVASWMVRSTFSRYEGATTRRGMTGAQAADAMLRHAGVVGYSIEPVSGRLSDHYDPRTRTLRLSEAVYGSRSISAIGVACHEAGHAIQHANSYAWLGLRSNLVPVTQIASNLGMPIIFAGFILAQLAPALGQMALLVGVACFAIAFLFAFVTLPVEWDASARAKRAMAEQGLLDRDELDGANKVLNAAFLTYLAAAISALLTLLYFLMRSGLLRR